MRIFGQKRRKKNGGCWVWYPPTPKYAASIKNPKGGGYKIRSPCRQHKVLLDKDGRFGPENGPDGGSNRLRAYNLASNQSRVQQEGLYQFHGNIIVIFKQNGIADVGSNNESNLKIVLFHV